MAKQNSSLKNWAVALLTAMLFLTGFAPALQAEDVIKTHALTLGDQPKYGPDFKHLDYVNPDAPKGGSETLSVVGAGDGASFDNFNPFTIRGTAAAMPGLYETLTTTPDDDALAGYGLIAASMELAKDRSWIIFNL